MKKIKTKLLTLGIIVVLAVAGLATLAACGNSGVTFTGGGEINGVDYNVSLKCKKDEEFSLTIKEIPELEITGKYEYDESKGYRFTFADQNDTIKVPKYDEATSTFTFTYTLILGDKYGTGNVTLSHVDKSFKFGGEAFFEPVVFYAFDPDVGNFGMTSCEAYMYLYEDGTLNVMASCPLTAAYAASGTWTFDAAANKYTFEYDAGGSGMGYMITAANAAGGYGPATPSETETTYNAETGAYELTIYYNLGLTSTLKLSTVF